MLRTILSGSIYWSLTVWLLYPRTHIGALASCTTYHLFYVRLSKNSFNAFRPWLPSRLGTISKLIFLSLLWKFISAHQVSSWKRMQRYDFFPKHQNFSRKNFNLNKKNIQDLIWVKSRHAINLIIYNARARPLTVCANSKQECLKSGSKTPVNRRITKLLQKDSQLFGGLHIYP